jgi:hypothetical protein
MYFNIKRRTQKWFTGKSAILGSKIENGMLSLLAEKQDRNNNRDK